MNNKSQFEVGDLVLIKNDQYNPRANPKFRKPFIGPFKIVQVLNNLNYKVDMSNGQVKTIHYNRLKEYQTNDRSFAPMTQGAKRGRPPKKPAPNQAQPQTRSTRASSRLVKTTQQSLLITIKNPETVVSSMKRYAPRRDKTID